LSISILSISALPCLPSISFYPPANPTPEEQKLVCDVVILDHLKQNQLKEKSREWGQVHKLLLNVVVLLNARDPIGARTILEEAREVYLLHNQSQNRIRYLIGAVAGIFVAAILGTALFLLSTTQAAPKPFIDPQLLIESRFPGPVTLYPSRAKWLLVCAGGTLFAAGGGLMIGQGDARGWFMLNFNSVFRAEKRFWSLRSL
jgi:hypothetical protein